MFLKILFFDLIIKKPAGYLLCKLNAAGIMLLLILCLEFILRIIIGSINKGVKYERTPPGAKFNNFFMILTLILFFTSLE